ncbi:alcohol dehydrogenase [Ranunculus cassubicifolius]
MKKKRRIIVCRVRICGHTGFLIGPRMVAVVTGGNTGIGFAFVKRLAELGLTVVLTCRDVSKGHKAVELLRLQGLHVRFFRVDLLDHSTFKDLALWLEKTMGGLDILVNNAGVSFNEIGENSMEHAEIVINTNYYGTKLLTEALLPLFRRSNRRSRILNISSRLGLLNKLRNPNMRKILEDQEYLSEDGIDFFIRRFVEDVKNGDWDKNGWPELWTDYAVSKLALNAYSMVLAKRFEAKGLSVNCFCPGYTQTSMTHGKGKHTADHVADIGTKLVLFPPFELPTGKFYTSSDQLLNSKL